MAGLSDLITAAAQAAQGSSSGAAAAGPLIAGYFAAPASGGPPVAQASGTPQTPEGFRVLDERRTPLKGIAPAGANGLITATYDPVPAGQLWKVERMTIECTSSTQTIALVYVGQAAPQNLVDGTEAGNLDFGEGVPILVPGSLSLIIVWTGASVGAIGTVTAQYRVLG